MSLIETDTETQDHRIAAELESLALETDLEIDQELVFEVMAQRCPPADPA